VGHLEISVTFLHLTNKNGRRALRQEMVGWWFLKNGRIASKNNSHLIGIYGVIVEKVAAPQSSMSLILSLSSFTAIRQNYRLIK